MEQTTAGKHAFQIKIEEGQSINATRIVGNTVGKRLVVTAGVHGDEYVGIQAIREILEELKPQKLAGQVIFVPVVNRDGFYEGTYLVPEDGENLNRCFPGSQKKVSHGVWHTHWNKRFIQMRIFYWTFTAGVLMNLWNLLPFSQLMQVR